MAENKYIFFRNDQHQQHFAFDPSRPDCLDHVEYRYFGRVLNLLEPLIKDMGLTIYVTAWTVDELPTYGPKVVSCILQDEWSRAPRYLEKVGAVFKTCGTFPYNAAAYKQGNIADFISNFLGQSLALKRDKLGHAKTFGNRLMGRKIAPVYSIPIGYFAREEVAFKPIVERQNDFYFAGSVQHKKNGKYAIKRPKELARSRMDAALSQLAKERPDLNIKTKMTGSFADSIKTDNGSYLENMMNTKICPIPRGANLETFRFYEAIRYGCIPVGEAFPEEDFYKDAPIIRLKNWSDLLKAALPILNNPDRLQQMHQDALRWWDDRCSEQALAMFMKDKLKGL